MFKRSLILTFMFHFKDIHLPHNFLMSTIESTIVEAVMLNPSDRFHHMEMIISAEYKLYFISMPIL